MDRASQAGPQWPCAPDVVALGAQLEQAETLGLQAIAEAAAAADAASDSCPELAALGYTALCSSSQAEALAQGECTSAGGACLDTGYAACVGGFVSAAALAVEQCAAVVTAAATCPDAPGGWARAPFAPVRWRHEAHAGGGHGLGHGHGHAHTLGDDPGAPGYDPESYAPSAEQIGQIQSQLGTALSPAQLSSVVGTYSGLSSAQQGSVLSMAQSIRRGQAPSWSTMAPLAAGGLALFGVSAPVVAIVAAAVPLISDLLSALGIGPGSQQCNWNVGGVCFSGNIPYGPDDPNWKTWDEFVALSQGLGTLPPVDAGGPGTIVAPPQYASLTPDSGQQLIAQLQSEGIIPASDNGGPLVAASFPLYPYTIACELVALDATIASGVPTQAPTTLRASPGGAGAFQGIVSRAQGPTAIIGATVVSSNGTPAPPNVGGGAYPGAGNVGGGEYPGAGQQSSTLDPVVLQVCLFLRTYYTLWLSNAEQAINGHPSATDADLLTQVASSWNLTHDPGVQFTFQPAQQTAQDLEAASSCWVVPGSDFADPGLPTFVSLLLAGQVDGVDEAPLTINVGPELAPAAAATSSSSSTAALVVGGAAVLGTIGWYMLKGGAESAVRRA